MPDDKQVVSGSITDDSQVFLAMFPVNLLQGHSYSIYDHLYHMLDVIYLLVVIFFNLELDQQDLHLYQLITR